MTAQPSVAPLDDPAYVPKHPPVDGSIPDVVARWGAASQLRWFRRFGPDLGIRKDWGLYHCHSEYHLGLCCTSCWDEAHTGVMQDGYCCCHDDRIGANRDR
jgi:hypothetical protein